MSGPPEKLLLGVSGSVAVLSLPAYLHAFRAAGVRQIVAVLTTTAARFLPAGSLAVLCDRVCTDEDPAGGHVALGRWADRALILPATANLLGTVAHGLAPTLLTTTVLAADCPVTFAPAMNPVMWQRPAVQRNVALLREDGHDVVDPIPGAAYEVASRAIVPSIVVPPAEVLLERLSAGAEVSA
ncbi:flavoprotein [Amycolatopsis sp. CA-161197]|uniref:flavoprotein n=1 Tax=unclassified Amycolatopsis TaxID=2618356 RepID=UPI0034545330